MQAEIGYIIVCNIQSFCICFLLFDKELKCLSIPNYNLFVCQAEKFINLGILKAVFTDLASLRYNASLFTSVSVLLKSWDVLFMNKKDSYRRKIFKKSHANCSWVKSCKNGLGVLFIWPMEMFHHKLFQYFTTNKYCNFKWQNCSLMCPKVGKYWSPQELIAVRITDKGLK